MDGSLTGDVSDVGEIRPSKLHIDGVSKRFGATTALRDVSLRVEDGAFLTLLGGSGSGKSTLLRVIAGLEEPDAGTIRIDGIDVTRTPPRARGLGMVFQNYSLFPHLTVAENVGYGLQVRGWSRARRRQRVADMLAMIHLPDLGARRPAELSGGQQQRVALARALAVGPSLLMLDEPLAALDVNLRHHLQLELRRLHRDSGTTFILVTHDQDEALLLSDRIAIMRDGQIEQVGTPDELYRAPANDFVATFVGRGVLLPARAIVGEPPSADVDGLGALRLATAPPAGPFKILLRPEQVVLGTRPTPHAVTIRDVTFQGGTTIYAAELPGGIALTARGLGAPNPALSPGASVFATITERVAWVA